MPKRWTHSLQVPWLGIEPRPQWGEHWRPPGLGSHSAVSWRWVFCSTLLYSFQPSASFLKRAFSVLLFSAVRLVGNQKHTQNDAFSHASAAAQPLFLTTRSSFPVVWPHHKCHPSLIGNACLLGLIGLACQECSPGIACQLTSLPIPWPCITPHQPWWQLLPGTTPRPRLLHPSFSSPVPSSGAPPHGIPVWGTTKCIGDVCDSSLCFLSDFWVSNYSQCVISLVIV